MRTRPRSITRTETRSRADWPTAVDAHGHAKRVADLSNPSAGRLTSVPTRPGCTGSDGVPGPLARIAAVAASRCRNAAPLLFGMYRAVARAVQRRGACDARGSGPVRHHHPGRAGPGRHHPRRRVYPPRVAPPPSPCRRSLLGDVTRLGGRRLNLYRTRAGSGRELLRIGKEGRPRPALSRPGGGRERGSSWACRGRPLRRRAPGRRREVLGEPPHRATELHPGRVHVLPSPTDAGHELTGWAHRHPLMRVSVPLAA